MRRLLPGREGSALTPSGKICAVFAVLLLTAGCQQNFFDSEGAVASQGGGLGRWSVRPEACTRDSFLETAEGEPAQDPKHSLLTFLWEDPANSMQRPDLYRAFGPDTPRRLEIASEKAGYTATLRTMKLPDGVAFSSRDCLFLNVLTHEGPAAEPHGRPLLGGELKLDCVVHPAGLPQSHITADVHFTRCGF